MALELLEKGRWSSKGGKKRYTFYPTDYRNPHQNDKELAAFSKEMLFKCLLTFIVILFYISEFLYQIQSSIVQQIILQNYYIQFQLVFLFAASTVRANLGFGGKRRQACNNQVKNHVPFFWRAEGTESPQIEDDSSPESVKMDMFSRKYRTLPP